MVECPEILEKADKIVVIDHHRLSDDSIDNAILSYVESYASSASELMTEIIQYTSNNEGLSTSLKRKRYGRNNGGYE